MIAAYSQALLESDENDGRLPLHKACAYTVPLHTVISALLNAQPTTAAVPDEAGHIPLQLLLTAGVALSAVDLLLRAYPAGRSAVDARGNSPLHQACECAHADASVLGALLGEDAETARACAAMRNAAGALPLHLLSRRRGGFCSLDCVAMLLHAFPAAASTADAEGMLPLHRACLVGSAYET